MYKILSKQNFSGALTLILIILLSQSNIMNLLFDTILGRTILALILLFISYTNKILGVVSTLLVLIMFACCNNYTENFSRKSIRAPASNNYTDPDGTINKINNKNAFKKPFGMSKTGMSKTGMSTTDMPTTDMATTDMATIVMSYPITSTGAIPTNMSKDKTKGMPKGMSKGKTKGMTKGISKGMSKGMSKTDMVTPNNLEDKYIVTEGFDILGTERNLQRGKKSNTIMVNEDMRKSENVDPYDGWNSQSYFTFIS